MMKHIVMVYELAVQKREAVMGDEKVVFDIPYWKPIEKFVGRGYDDVTALMATLDPGRYEPGPTRVWEYTTEPHTSAEDIQMERPPQKWWAT